MRPSGAAGARAEDAAQSRRPALRRMAAARSAPVGVEPPTPLWVSGVGLAGGVGFCGLAAFSTAPFETVALLSGAAAAGGLGLYGLLERLSRRGAGAAWAEGGAARALIDAVDDPMAVLDQYGAVVAANAAAARVSAYGKPPIRAVQLLGGAADAEETVFRLLGAALGGRPAEAVVATGSGHDAAVSVWPIGGGLALWRQSERPGLQREPDGDRRRSASRREAAGAPERAWRAAEPGFDAEIAEAAGVGWFRLDRAGRIVDADRVIRRWLGPRAGEAAALRTVLPEAGYGGAGAESGAEAGRSRLVGAPGAPREVAYVLAPAGAEGLRIGVAAAAGGPRRGAERRSPATTDLGEDLFQSAPYPVLLLSAEGRITHANLAAERLFAAMGADGPIAGPSGDFLLDWIAERDAQRAQRAFDAAARGGRGADTSLIVQWANADGAERGPKSDPQELDLVFRPYAQSTEAPAASGSAVAAFLLDASERRGLERNIAQAQKMQAIGELAGGVAHDFNNMLTVIIGGCEKLAARMTAEDPDAEELKAIEQSALRAATLVKHLLAYSRKQRLEPTVANLTDVVSDLTLVLNRLLVRKVFLQTDLAEEVWPVLVDVNQLSHALTNLVVNARDAMKDGGRILLRTRNVAFDEPQYGPNFTMPPGPYVRLDVADEGPGVPENIQEKIFEPFFTTKKVGQGTGLGLSMALGVIKQSQGYLFLESAPSAGAVFSIYLPRCSEEAALAARRAEEAAAARAEAAAASDSQGRTILLVDDEAAVRHVAAAHLTSRGYVVIEAADGAEALEKLEDPSLRIDLMLSDVVMPDIDGPSVLKALGGRRPEMRTVFMTGYARDNFSETLEQSNGPQRRFGVLQKPFRREALLQAVAEALEAAE